MILECPHCVAHEFQDKQYGTKKRVMNPIQTKGGHPEYRCTVCDKTTKE